MDLEAKLKLKNEGFVNPLEMARKDMENFKGVAEKITGVLGAIGVSFAAFKSAEGFTEGLKGVFEFARTLRSESAITGQSVKDMVVLRQAYRDAGLDAGGVSTSLVMLQRALGGVNDEGQPTKEIFRQLHLNMAQLSNASAITQFEAISKAIAGLGSQAAKTAAITEMFGRSGAQMEALFANPKAIEEARRAVGAMGDTMQRNAAIFAHISNAFELLGEQGQRFFAGFGGQIAPMLDGLLTKINAIDLTKLGEQVGGVVKTLYAAFQSGDLGKLVSLSLQIGIESGMKALTDQRTWEALGDLIKGSFQGLGAMVIDSFTPALNMVNAVIAEAVSKLTGGKVDPQRDLAKQTLGIAESQTTTEQALMDKALADLQKTKYGTPAYAAAGKRFDAHKRLFNDAMARENAATPLALDGANISLAERYNFEGYISPLADVMKNKQASSGKGFADASRRLSEMMADVRNVAPEKMAEINALVADIQSKIPKAPQIEAPAGGGTGRISGVRAPSGGDKRENEVDRFAKVGLFIGGAGGPQIDFARRTADNTSKMVEGQKTLTGLMQQLLTGRGTTEELIWGQG